jgi:hypothetical protein
MVGNTTGPLVAGILADRTGNYEAGFTILAVLSVLGSVFFILARPPSRPSTGEPVSKPVEPLPSAPAPATATP